MSRLCLDWLESYIIKENVEDVEENQEGIENEEDLLESIEWRNIVNRIGEEAIEQEYIERKSMLSEQMHEITDLWNNLVAEETKMKDNQKREEIETTIAEERKEEEEEEERLKKEEEKKREEEERIQKEEEEKGTSRFEIPSFL